MNSSKNGLRERTPLLQNASPTTSTYHACDVQVPLSKPKDRSFWVVFFLTCVPVYAVTPLSWCFVLWNLRTGSLRELSSHGLGFKVLFGYCAFESIFSIYYQVIARLARRDKSQATRKSVPELQHLFNRVLHTGLGPAVPSPSESASILDIPQLSYNDPRAADFRAHFRLWFGGRPWKEISRESVEGWLAWSMFDQRLNTLDDDQRAAVDEALRGLDRRTGGRLGENATTESQRVITLTWDVVNVWSRPAVIYIFSDLWNRGSNLYLRWKFGMVLAEFEGIDYLIRDGTSSESSSAETETETETPLIFMHGLGFGLAQYVLTIAFLLRSLPKSQSVIIPIQPNISQAILHPLHLTPLPREKWISGLRNLIHKFGWEADGVTMVSHSKGSLVHAWLLKDHPKLIKRNCFMDPVCFCLWEADLAYNFVYRTPSTGFELMLKYFTATEPGIALAVQRHFDWASSTLFVEDIPHAADPYYSAYFLGGRDPIINSSRVRHYLENDGDVHEPTIHWNQDGLHAQAALFETGLEQLKTWLLAPPPEASSTR